MKIAYDYDYDYGYEEEMPHRMKGHRDAKRSDNAKQVSKARRQARRDHEDAILLASCGMTVKEKKRENRARRQAAERRNHKYDD